MRLTQKGYLASDIDDSDVSRTFARVRPLQNQGLERHAAVAVRPEFPVEDFVDLISTRTLAAIFMRWCMYGRPGLLSLAHVSAGQESPSDDDEMPF